MLLLLLAALDLFLHYDASTFVLFRLPRVLTSIICGGSLALSGWALQTLFRNPLAGPYITGITPGATFFIGLSMLLLPSQLASIPFLHLISSAGFGVIGALIILILQLKINQKSSSIYALLLTGVMFGYFLNAGTEILQNIASAIQLQQFVQWGMGNFDRVELWQTGILTIILVIALFYFSANTLKLDGFLPGDAYAQTAGIDTKSFSRNLILVTGILAALCTAFCGPIGFVGLAAPHLSRILFQTQSHRTALLPTLLIGSVFCCLADLLSHHLGDYYNVGVNAVCALLGAPIVLWVMLKHRL